MSAVAPPTEAPVAWNAKFQMQDYLAEMFFSYVGQVIEFDRPTDASGISGGRVALELLDVRKPNTGAEAQGFRKPFALLFALRSPEPLGRGLHRIAHADFEPDDWFITRVLVPGRYPDVAYYEAVFG